MNKKIVYLFFWIIPICGLSQKKKNASVKPPNIILILADDMGYSDLGCYGGEIHTPNLDKLASGGIRFRQFYNGARCCPSRASLMTGLYPHQAGIGHMTNDPENSTAFNYGLPGYLGDLNDQCVTLAEVLKPAGYTTLMAGKWHLGYHDRKKWPLQRGFDKYYGILAGAANYFHPSGQRGLTLMNDTVSADAPDFYLTDAFTNHAISYLKECMNQKEKPFFLYMAYTSPHWPLNALKNDINTYRNTYKKGWTALRRERLERMKQIGVVSSGMHLSADDGADWDSLSTDKQDEMDYRMAIYAAQIDRMDQNIGRIIQTLEKAGQLENTLIFFLADNGACAEGGLLGGGKKELLGTEGGYFLTYGQSWANASDTPFKKYKHWVHEGGISTPLIVHWPAAIPVSLNGSFTDQYGFLPDIMATIADASGAIYPKKFNGHSIIPMQGKSILPLLSGKDVPIHHEPIFWEHEGNAAVRYGNLKLVKEFKPNDSSRWELYDISKDRSELRNLSSSMPRMVAEMSNAYNQWTKKVGVVPYDMILKIKKEKGDEKKIHSKH
ncbi:arylsulfatase [bacterium A37T11]|nr:arylsulfatase [bacterium A37T11]